MRGGNRKLCPRKKKNVWWSIKWRGIRHKVLFSFFPFARGRPEPYVFFASFFAFVLFLICLANGCYLCVCLLAATVLAKTQIQIMQNISFWWSLRKLRHIYIHKETYLVFDNDCVHVCKCVFRCECVCTCVCVCVMGTVQAAWEQLAQRTSWLPGLE